jgi:PAS domain-containing protein
VAEDAAAVAEGDVRRLTRALSRSGISNDGAAATAPAEDTSDEEEVAALYSLEEGEAGAVRRALPCASSAFPDVPARLLSHLFRVPSAFVLSDPRKEDCPIVFASDAFLRMTGYGRDEVVGRNCRFLQQRHLGSGSGSSDAAAATPNAAAEAASASELSRLREALNADPPKPATVTLLNFKKDGTPFWNALHVAPVRDADGRVEFYVGVQLDVTGGGGGEEAAAAAPAAPLSLPQRLAHSSTTGAVRVACRSRMGEAGGLRRSVDWQALPKRGWCSKQQREQQQQQRGGGGEGGAA